MHTYKIIYTVNGSRTEEEVSAYDSSNAKRLVQDKYVESIHIHQIHLIN